MIKFNKVYFQYDQNAIFEDFSCSFSEQKINCIVGPSGCGKTTMLNMVANIIKPTRGSILGLNKHVSYLFQEERLINEITVFKNLDFILKGPYKDASERKNIIIEGLNSVDLKETIDMFPNQLSGSMKRRLALLRAFLYPSKILLMDEPFSGLDINIKQQIIKLFIDLWNKDKRTVFFVSHDIDEALSVGNNIYVMTQKPMKILKEFVIGAQPSKRQLYDNESVEIKKQILQTIEKW